MNQGYPHPCASRTLPGRAPPQNLLSRQIVCGPRISSASGTSGSGRPVPPSFTSGSNHRGAKSAIMADESSRKRTFRKYSYRGWTWSSSWTCPRASWSSSWPRASAAGKLGGQDAGPQGRMPGPRGLQAARPGTPSRRQPWPGPWAVRAQRGGELAALCTRSMPFSMRGQARLRHTGAPATRDFMVLRRIPVISRHQFPASRSRSLVSTSLAPSHPLFTGSLAASSAVT